MTTHTLLFDAYRGMYIPIQGLVSAKTKMSAWQTLADLRNYIREFEKFF